MPLNLSKLNNVQRFGAKTTAACPACQQAGRDKKGDHLVIWPDGKFGCAANDGDTGHRKLIFSLAGDGKGKSGVTSEEHEEIQPQKPRVKHAKIWSSAVLSRLLPETSYWGKRGINDITLNKFSGGLATQGKMNQRYVFPVYSLQNRIVGFAGRAIYQQKLPTWKLIGGKLNWLYPCHLNRTTIIKKKEVILVEGISDVLSFFEAGIENVMCIFGTKLSNKLLCYLLSLNLNKIIIATNNEPDNESIGNKAAVEIREKLVPSYYSEKSVIIKLPPVKDFNLMTKQQILEWYGKKND